MAAVAVVCHCRLVEFLVTGVRVFVLLEQMMQHICEYVSPIGPLTLSSDGENITGLWMKGQKYYGHTLEKETSEERVAVFDAAAAWLDAYFEGEAPPCLLPLAPRGSPFRQAVWKRLCAIPYGSVTTYGKIAQSVAREMGLPSMSAQAVGGAVGHNQISIIIPCHRVVGTDGGLTGFAGGIEKKKWLLALEKAGTPSLFDPHP